MNKTFLIAISLTILVLASNHANADIIYDDDGRIVGNNGYLIKYGTCSEVFGDCSQQETLPYQTSLEASNALEPIYSMFDGLEFTEALAFGLTPLGCTRDRIGADIFDDYNGECVIYAPWRIFELDGTDVIDIALTYADFSGGRFFTDLDYNFTGNPWYERAFSVNKERKVFWAVDEALLVSAPSSIFFILLIAFGLIAYRKPFNNRL